MKKIIFFFLMLLNFFGFSQYPLKTVFKRDSVVIMTTDQFEGFDLMISNQKSRSEKYKAEIELLEKKNQYLNLLLSEKDSLKKINDSLLIVTKNKLDSIENWITEISIDNAWIYYDWLDYSIKYVDLSMYAFWGNKHNGKITLFRRSGSVKNPDINFWKKVNREYPQVFESEWITYYRKKRKPVLLKYPFKIYTPSYKPKEIIEIKLSE